MAVIAPQKKPQQQQGMGLGQLLGGIGTVAGGILGGIYGGPGGAVAGSTAGGQLGSTIGGVIEPPKAPEQPDPVPTIQASGGGDAMSRRLAQLNESPSQQIVEAGKALNNMPPELQAEYKPILSKAYAATRAGRIG